MLNHDHWGHPLDQNKSWSITPGSRKPNNNSRCRVNHKALLMTPPSPRITQPNIRGRFLHGNFFSHSPSEITFNHHQNTQFTTTLIKEPETVEIHTTLWHIEQQIHHMVTKVSMIGDLFSLMAHLMAIFLVSIIITIYITLNHPEATRVAQARYTVNETSLLISVMVDQPSSRQ